jgi:hypothetical protein
VRIRISIAEPLFLARTWVGKRPQRWSIEAPNTSPELEVIETEIRRVAMSIRLAEAQLAYLKEKRSEETARIQDERSEAGEDL